MNDKTDHESKRLQKHLSSLQEVSKVFYQLELGLDEILKIVLKILIEDLNFDMVIIFLYDEYSRSLECAQATKKDKGIIAGESRIPVTDNDADLVSSVFLGKMDYALFGDDLQLCMALRAGDDRIGVLIVDKLLSKTSIAQEEIGFLTDYVKEISKNIQHVKTYQSNFRKVSMLLALSKISEAMASAMEFETALSIILNSAIEILKFDRAKLYLIDKEENLLKGQISADIRKVVKPITSERYPLTAEGDKDADILSETNLDIVLRGEYETANLFYYVPLVAKETKIGILVVDNVFSRQPITQEDKENLVTLANHAAVTIENAKLYERVKELSIRDSLTGLYVHGYFLQRLEQEIERARRFKDIFSLMIIDIDDFKKYNDVYGHSVGDRILELLTDLLKRKSRSIDIAGRYGGDEFVVILPRISHDIASLVAKRFHELIGKQRLFLEDKEISFTVSIGIAVFPVDGVDKEELFRRADKALYWAKQHGKNQICLAKNANKE